MSPKKILGVIAASALVFAFEVGSLKAAEEPDTSDSTFPPLQSEPHFDFDALFTYGLGNGHALGTKLRAAATFDVWRTKAALGSLDLGVYGGYVNEPIELQAWMVDSATTGTTHRIPFGATFGQSFHFGRDDAYAFGMHAYLGAVHWISTYRVRYPSRGIEGDGEATDTVLDAGFLLRFAARPHPNVGIAMELGAPFYGIGPETVVGLFTTGVGITLRGN